MLETVKSDIERLIAVYEREKAKNALLSSELEESRKKIEHYTKQIEELSNQIESLKLQTAFTGSSSDTEAAKKKVEKLIREIDKCISLMEA